MIFPTKKNNVWGHAVRKNGMDGGETGLKSPLDLDPFELEEKVFRLF
ncbi:hypothetical protein [Leptospira adleri]|nr:hypothetical protein [Leptospira adleri]